MPLLTVWQLDLNGPVKQLAGASATTTSEAAAELRMSMALVGQSTTLTSELAALLNLALPLAGQSTTTTTELAALLKLAIPIAGQSTTLTSEAAALLKMAMALAGQSITLTSDVGTLNPGIPASAGIVSAGGTSDRIREFLAAYVALRASARVVEGQQSRRRRGRIRPLAGISLTLSHELARLDVVRTPSILPVTAAITVDLSVVPLPSTVELAELLALGILEPDELLLLEVA